MNRWFSAPCSALLLASLAGCTGQAPSRSTVPIVSPTGAPTMPLATASPPTVLPDPTLTADGPCTEKVVLPGGRRSISSAETDTPFGVEITFSDGWHGCGLAFKELGEPYGVMMLGYWDVRMVYPDPCHWKGDVMNPDTGPSVKDLMRALVSQKLTMAGPIEPITMDGYQGRYVRLEVAPHLDTSGCDIGTIAEFRFWNGPGESVWWLGAADAPGLIGEVWALDVDGFRFVIQAASFADAGEARRDEIRRIVESIDIQP